MATLITLERLNLSLKNVQNSLAALTAKMPTKVSQLTNDLNYMTTETTNKLISIETARAKEAEQANATSIDSLQTDLATETSRAKAAEKANSDSIADLNTQLDGVADALAAI